MASIKEVGAPQVPLLHRITAGQWIWIDVGVSAVLFLGGLSSLIHSGAGHRLPDHFALLVIALGMATLPLPLRRAVPIPVLFVITVGIVMGTLFGQGIAGTPVVALPLYTVASQEDRRRSLVGASIVIVAFLCALGIATLQKSNGGNIALYDATDNLIAIAVAWFIGDSVRSRRAFVEGTSLQAEQRRRLEVERAQTSIAEERLHIARELHDIVAHSLGVIAIQAGVGHHVLDAQPEEARKALAAIETTSRSALTDLRWVLGVLRSDDSDGPSFNPAPGMADLERLLGETRDAGLDVSLKRQGDAVAVSPSLDLSLYRIIQEALTNVTKHANAAHAVVAVTYEEEAVVVSVIDDGNSRRAGTNLASIDDNDHGTHHGIVGMRERAAMYGGSLFAEPRPGGGFEVRARLPLKPSHP